MNQYRVQVWKFMDESLRARPDWYWVGDYYMSMDAALPVAKEFEEVYAKVRIVHQGKVVYG